MDREDPYRKCYDMCHHDLAHGMLLSDMDTDGPFKVDMTKPPIAIHPALRSLLLAAQRPSRSVQRRILNPAPTAAMWTRGTGISPTLWTAGFSRWRSNVTRTS